MATGQAIVGNAFLVGIVAVGVIYIWKAKVGAKQRVKQDSFSTFFLGGGQVGSRLTSNNNWGLCFAFANSIWYYAFLGYYYGPLIFLLQAAWSISVIVIAYNLRRYINGSRDGTVHGFIGRLYGPNAALLAATATLLGYTLNVGFEIFYSAHLLSSIFHGISLELFIAIAIALFVGGYCLLGGYVGSVETDPLQNKLGVLSLLILLGLVAAPLIEHGGAMPLTGAPFAIPSPAFIVGVITFSFFFNLVDMANWQSVAANRDLPDNQLDGVRTGLVWSAVLQLLAPALLATLFGAGLKLLEGNLGDDSYFIAVLGTPLGSIDVRTGFLVGFLILGFFSVTISSAGSYLLAAMQTLTVDVFHRRRAATMRDPAASVEERTLAEYRVLSWVKRGIVPVAVIMTLAFAGLYYLLGTINKSNLAFQFQFVMYGAATTLVPAVLYGLFRAPHADEKAHVGRAGFYSILAGLIFVVGPFAAAQLWWETIKAAPQALGISATPDDIVNLAPLFGLVASAVTFWFVRRRDSRRGA
jgi:hypothetical protein